MKMNKLVLLLSMAAMGVSVAQAAAPTAELKVKGIITPGGCTVAAPDNGEYDFGRIPADVIDPNVAVSKHNQTKNWVVTCDADTALTFKIVDNRAASVIDDYVGETYGLGLVNGTGKIGAFAVSQLNSKIDGVAVKNLNTRTGKIETLANQIDPSVTTAGWLNASGNALGTGKVFSADLAVNLLLGSMKEMNGPVTADVNLDGSATLNFAYGI